MPSVLPLPSPNLLRIARTHLGQVAGAFALILAATLAFAPAALAKALTPSNVTGTYSQGGTTLGPDDSINQYSKVTFDVSFDLPPDAASGDTFDLTLPEEFQGYRESFTLTEGSETVATCEPTPESGPVRGYRCELTDWVAGKDELTGFELHVDLQALSPAEGGTIGVDVGGTEVTFPSDIVVPDVVPPSESIKSGYIDPATGHVMWEWVILFPEGATSVTVTDPLPEGTTFVGIADAQLRELGRWSEYYPSNDPLTDPYPIGEGSGYTLSTGESGGRDEVTMTIPAQGDYDVAVVTIETSVDAGVPAGAEFENTATIASQIPGEEPIPDEIGGKTTWEFGAGGSGSGEVTDVLVTKVVTGEGAPSRESYDVVLDCSDPAGEAFDGSPWSYALVPDTPIRLPDFGAGSTCTITESAESAADADVSYSPSQTFTVVDDGDLTFEVTVTNDYPPAPDPINLTLTKELVGEELVHPGETVSFALVPHNDGPGEAIAGWSITDLAPGGTTLISATGSGYVCTGATCVAQSVLAAGVDGPALTVTVQVPGDATVGTYRNVAYVAPEAGDVAETNPLTVPGAETDTATSETDNDAEAAFRVVLDPTTELPPTPPPVPGVDPTPPVTEPPVTDPGVDPTAPPVTEPGVDPTPPVTDPGVDPTEPPVTDPTPTDPGIDPTEPVTDPTRPPVLPSTGTGGQSALALAGLFVMAGVGLVARRRIYER